MFFFFFFSISYDLSEFNCRLSPYLEKKLFLFWRSLGPRYRLLPYNFITQHVLKMKSWVAKADLNWHEGTYSLYLLYSEYHIFRFRVVMYVCRLLPQSAGAITKYSVYVLRSLSQFEEFWNMSGPKGFEFGYGEV